MTSRTATFARLAAAMLAFSAAGTAFATTGFTGPLAPANWTTATSGSAFGSNVNTSGAPGSIKLTGGDDSTGSGCAGVSPGFIGGCQISFTTALANQDWSFQWSYATTDISPQYDQFGVVVDGVRTELIANGGNLAQSGTFSVHANSTFGFWLNCTDCTGGSASVTVSNISAVPEPGAIALMAVGLPLLWAASRRRRNTVR